MEWWLSILTPVKKFSNYYLCKCPAHEDRKPSLSIFPKGEGCQVHCFAGCKYKDIISATEQMGQTGGTTPAISFSPTIVTEASSWWESYTGVAIELWDLWGASIKDSTICFTWEGLSTKKLRIIPGKSFLWEGVSPPLWPKVPKELEGEIFLTEGETDAGVLRFLGLQAFALTGGCETRFPISLWTDLRSRGVTKATILFDIDSAGQRAAERVKTASCGCIPITIGDMSPLLDTTLGEKDIRDYYLRVKSFIPIEDIRENILSLHSPSAPPVNIVTLDMLPKNSKILYIWENILPASGISIIAGQPKSGKSTLLFGLLAALAQGKSDFIGSSLYRRNPFTCLLLTEEDPAVLADRNSLSGPFPGLEAFTRSEALKRKYGWKETCLIIQETLVKKQYDMLVIDTFSEWTMIQDENDASEVLSKMQELKAVLPDESISVLLIHHARKQTGKYGLRVRGSSALIGSVDTLIELERKEDVRTLNILSRFTGTVRRKDFRYDPEDRTFGEEEYFDIDI